MSFSNIPYAEVDADKWADIVSDFRTYATEGRAENGNSVMYFKLAQGQHVGEIISEVEYPQQGGRVYRVISTLLEN